MSRQNKDMPAVSGKQITNVKKISATVGVADFTDGGSTAGTYALTELIPKGARVIGCNVEVTAAFAGDTSAVLVVGDGSDVDRYNTGTPSIFAAAASVNMGVPSGAVHHGAAATPTLTVTSGLDFGAISGGRLILEILYV